MRVIEWGGASDDTEKIGTAEPETSATLKGIKVGETVLIRSESGEFMRTVAAIRSDGPYIELAFRPVFVQRPRDGVN